MLMLIDTADPRYHPQRPERPDRREHALPRLRPGFWVPLVAAIVCLSLAGSVSPFAGYLLAMASLGLFMRAGLGLMPRGDGLPKHRQ